MNIYLPDGTALDMQENSTIADVAKKIGPGLAKAAIAGKINSNLVDLDTKVTQDDKVEIITNKSPEALPIMRHSTAHVLAEAVQTLYPGVQIGFGPKTDTGFFYDFKFDVAVSSDDFEKIETTMAEIIAKKEPFVKKIVTKDQAKEIFKDQKFKLEHIDDLDNNTEIIVRQHGDFVDLCSGVHVPDSSFIGPFKLLKISGAYWKGDSTNIQMTRIYGTAFLKKKDLDEYLHNLEEANKRDHRKLGKELGIYAMNEMAGVGLPLYLPKGALIIRKMQDWLRNDLIDAGYEEVITPHVYNADVWKCSGHYDFYKENMYFFNVNEGNEKNPRVSEYGVKPMNCPGHVMLYKAEQHSYKDLPLRYFEFGTVYRHEMSGVVHGLLRARGFTQDDAHVFCTRNQLIDEVVAILNLVDHIMSTFNFKYEAEISTRPDKSIGTDDMWEHATNVLKKACEIHKLNYDINEGDGAFYGPKIDIKVKDAIGRTWQCSTVQVDFNLPERFDLTYKTEDNKVARPWMLHRAIFGSIERFLGILIEHYAGALPFWLSPVQVAILPIADRHLDASYSLVEKIKKAGGRAEVYKDSEPMRVKIAKAQANKVPYMIVLGDKEIENGQLAIRDRHKGDIGKMSIEDFINLVKENNKI